MSLINFEHFETYGTANGSTAAPSGAQLFLLNRGYTYGVRTPDLVASLARTGSICCRCPGAGNDTWIRFAIPGTARTVMGSGAAVRLDSMASSNLADLAQGMRFGTAADAINIRVLLEANGVIRISQAGTTRASSPNNSYPAGSYFWLETKIITGTGSATVEVRVNGTTVVTATGLTIAAINQVTLGQFGTANTPQASYDDWVIWDNAGTENNDWMGDTFVVVAAPTADTAVNDFVPSTGTARWDMIDELTPNDADFLTANAAGNNQELTTATPTLPTTGAVVAVASQVRALKTDTGVSTINHGIAVGGSSNVSAGINLGTGAVGYVHIVERNPDGNVAWTQTTAQAARLRMQRAA